MKEIEKPWGKEELLEVNKKYVLKRITIDAGKKISLQYHNVKLETMYFLEGTGKKTINKTESSIKQGDYITIGPKIIHRICANTKLIFLETSTPELDDVVRLEDDYDRLTKEK